jgi:hypothetical protein
MTQISAVAETFFSLLSIRILPHQQDTGGFFVAVIKKVRPLAQEAAAKAGDEKAAADSTTEDKVPWRLQRKRRRLHGYKEDPFVFFTEDEPLLPSLRYPFSLQYLRFESDVRLCYIFVYDGPSMTVCQMKTFKV